MKHYEWDYLVERTMQFCTLAHTEEERKTEKYYIKRCEMVDEEYTIEFQYHLGEFSKQPTTGHLIEVADGIGDTIFVCIQAAMINTPSSLEWDYINKPKGSLYKDTFVTPIRDVIKVGEDLGLDVFGITKDICDSNMSKIPKLTEVMSMYGVCPVVACDAAADWIESGLTASDSSISINWGIHTCSEGYERVVFKDQYGKVRKWVNYIAPDLKRFVTKGTFI